MTPSSRLFLATSLISEHHEAQCKQETKAGALHLMDGQTTYTEVVGDKPPSSLVITIMVSGFEE